MRALFVLAVMAGCHVPDTNSGPDASQAVSYQLGLTSRYLDPEAALAGLSVWVDGVERELADGPVVRASFENMEVAAGSTNTIELRYGEVVLDTLVQSPGDICTSDRGNNNPLLSETVNLCLRSNGEIQVNDFSCEYQRTGYFTADVFCPTDCHPLLGQPVCGEERCGLVMTNLQPRFGLLACMEAGPLELGASCQQPELGEPDRCATGLACVRGACRPFCVSPADCQPDELCESALSNDAEPRVCVDPRDAPRGELAQP